MKKPNILIALFFLFIVSITYRNLSFVFYQQDEWWTIGHLLTEPFGGLFSGFSIPGLIAGGGRVLSIPLLYFLYSFPLLETKQFAIFAILFHFLNVTVLFLITQRLSKSTFMALIAGLFFAIESVGTQAIVWIGANTTTLPSTFCILLSIYFYIVFLQSEGKRYFYLSMCLALAAYFFKESAVFLFILLPAMYIIFGKKQTSFIELTKKHALLIGYAALAIFIRLFELFRFTGIKPTSNVIGNPHPVLGLVLHGVFYPFESLSQMFFPPGFLFTVSDYFGKVMYTRLWSTPSAPIAIETIGAETISILLSVALLILLCIIYWYSPKIRKIILFSVLFTFLSFLPYVPLEKGNAYLDSRYFYIGVAGGGILLGLIFYMLRDFCIQRLKVSILFIYGVLFLFFLFFFYTHFAAIQRDIDMQVEVAKERKNFLITVQTLYPNLSNKNIFYITGNKDYYIEGNKTPFQQGMGYALMVLYYKSGSVPKELLRQSFLWDINAQGYKEVNGKGFGYYSDLQKLRKDIDNNRVKKENVIGLFYDGNSKSLKETISTTFK